jgi:hypothetical protein
MLQRRQEERRKEREQAHSEILDMSEAGKSEPLEKDREMGGPW